ncbi:hypothetical protein AWB65_06466 [Caballeronia humi]|uniref:Uncharacterized protein n=1 Tax=Caballeronia humi TaxID=326474 RepID=A0A158JEB5_9BURK|nr:hypothetical protein AWB65_06466 [Caballeronia humi]
MRADKHGVGDKTEQFYNSEYGLHGGLEVYQRHARLNARKRIGYTALIVAGIALLAISLFGLVAIFQFRGAPDPPLGSTSSPLIRDPRSAGSPAPVCQTSCASAEISDAHP